MEIPSSTIQLFVPCGIPKLAPILDEWTEHLKTILEVMDALDKFMEDNADNVFLGHSIFAGEQLRALGEHIRGWLEETAMKAGADTANAQARAMLAEYDNDELIQVFDTGSRRSEGLEVIGFMFLIDFTVDDESLNHLIDYKLKRNTK